MRPKAYLRQFVWIALAAGLSIAPALANISYTCAPNIDSLAPGTCSYLNNEIGGSYGVYGMTFSNATANIYIQFGSTGLGESNTELNLITYGDYATALAAHASGNDVDLAALNALSTYDTPAYGSGNVAVSTALGQALGLSGLIGVTQGGIPCLIGDSGCYDGVITVTNSISSLYFRQNGGSVGGSQYDYYSVVEHETDEVLGTTSCITTQTNPLKDECGSGVPSAADLFRYSSAGNLVLDSALSTTAGAYFSYNGGATNGANGAIFNTLDNGEDYADFASTCTFVQDAVGCQGKKLDIGTDGNAEINILDAVGYNVVPEPTTMAMLGGGLVLIGVAARRRKR